MIQVKHVEVDFNEGVNLEGIQFLLDAGKQGFTHIIDTPESGFILANGYIGYEMSEREADSIMAHLENDADEELTEPGIYVLRNGLKVKLLIEGEKE